MSCPRPCQNFSSSDKTHTKILHIIFSKKALWAVRGYAQILIIYLATEKKILHFIFVIFCQQKSTIRSPRLCQNLHYLIGHSKILHFISVIFVAKKHYEPQETMPKFSLSIGHYSILHFRYVIFVNKKKHYELPKAKPKFSLSDRTHQNSSSYICHLYSQKKKHYKLSQNMPKFSSSNWPQQNSLFSIFVIFCCKKHYEKQKAMPKFSLSDRIQQNSSFL